MQKELVLACIVGPLYLVYGLSVLLYAKQWKKIAAAFERDHFAFLPIAMVGLLFGLILVCAYNIWEWNPFVVITLTGWVLFISSVFYFLAPEPWIRAAFRCPLCKSTPFFYLMGAVMTAAGALLMYSGYFAR